MDADKLYLQVAREFGQPLVRLAAAYELDAAHRQDLLQEVHLALWRSLPGYRQQCSLRTWVYRVAHNTAITHVRRQRRHGRITLVTLEELEDVAGDSDVETSVHDSAVRARVALLLERLKPMDRQVVLLYLEGIPAVEVGEILGISADLVSQKVHRAKTFLKQQLLDGEQHERQR